VADLEENFGADLFAREVDYLTKEEWAHTAEDVLWRRTKLGLRVSQADIDRLAAYLAARR
jgi:glycerol-3-phosphate dehydrogenase